MSNSTQYWKEYERIGQEARAFLASADTTDGEAMAQFDRMMAEADAAKANAKRHEQLDAFDSALGSIDPRRLVETRSIADVEIDGEDEHTRSFREYMRSGVETRNISTLTDAAGGYLVPKTLSDSLIVALKSFGGVLSVANVFTTAAGNPYNQPTFDNTAYKARIVAQLGSVSPQAPVFGSKTLGAFTYTADNIVISKEALQDSSYDLEGIVTGAMIEAFGRGFNEDMTVGSGSGEPEGVHTAAVAANLMKVTTSNVVTEAITYDGLVDAQHSINSAYRYNGKWMFNDATLATIRKLKDTTGNPIWQPGTVAGAPDTLLGKTVVINDDMPSAAQGATPILFGDFSKYHVRMVKDFSVQRLNETMAKNHAVEFVGYGRADAKLMDTKSIGGLKIRT